MERRFVELNNKWKVILSLAASLFMLSFSCANFALFNVHTSSGNYFKLSYFIISLVCSALIFVLGGLKFNMSEIWKKITGVLAYIIAIIGAMSISVVVCEGFAGTPFIYLVNVCFYLVFGAIGLMISGSMRVSAFFALGASLIYNGVSFIIYSFRGSPLMPTDFLAISTAMGVAGQYKFKLKYQLITAVLLAIVHFAFVIKFPIKFNVGKSRWILHLAGLFGTVAVLFFILNVDYSAYDVSVFDQKYANRKHGSAVAFYVNASKMGLKANEDYSPDSVDEKLMAYGDEYSIKSNSPHIIVIMNESFSDLRTVGDFETNIEFLPYFKSLKKNTIKGEMLVSPFGGYTCNSEYEFLTGMNTGLLDSQSIPYMHMINSNMPYTLNTHMKGLGYTTTAIHPYYAKGWNRNIVYNYMGFDKFISFHDFKNLDKEQDFYRNYISDECNYRMVLDNLYNKEKGEKKFIFNITMQNHGGYEYKDFEPDVTIESMNGNYPKAEQYLSCIRQSDIALENLLNELKKYPEPVVVAMFGDHQPSVEVSFFEELYGAKLDDLDDESLERRYRTPFMIWANYNIKSKQNVKSSPCFLSNMIMEVAGLPKSRVQMYLDDLQKDIKQLNPLGYYDAEGVWHKHEDYPELKSYYDLQFSLLNGEKLNYDLEVFNNHYDILENYVISPFYMFKEEIDAIRSENSK